MKTLGALLDRYKVFSSLYSLRFKEFLSNPNRVNTLLKEKAENNLKETIKEINKLIQSNGMFVKYCYPNGDTYDAYFSNCNEAEIRAYLKEVYHKELIILEIREIRMLSIKIPTIENHNSQK